MQRAAVKVVPSRRSSRPPAEAKWKVRCLQYGSLLLVLAIWYLAVGPGHASPFILPSPSAVARALPGLLTSSETWAGLKATGYQVAWAFVIAASLGLAVGILGSRSVLSQRAVEPVLLYAFMAPLILLYPIVVLIFGLGDSSKIAFGVINGFFPMALNTLRGFAAVDPRLLRLARSLGATGLREMAVFRFPAARPMVFAGLRNCLALCVVAVIAGEILGSTGGLGYLIARAASTLSTTTLYGYIIVTVALAAILHSLLSRSETFRDGARS